MTHDPYPGTYVPYHLHTDYSLLDSCSKPQEYIDNAVRDGIKAISFSEHGKPLNWPEKLEMCKNAGIKYIHSVEIYLTESLDERVRDNYHTILIAKNNEGVKEINKLVSISCNETHFYYTNRISFEEFINISDNVITTSACLASPLNKLDEENPMYKTLVNRYDYLEVQPHNHPEQIEFNKKLLRLSREFNKPLIAATDTHSSSQYKAECRKILLKSKHKSYGDEDAFDLTYKTYDELVEAFRVQNAIPEEIYLEAINNTNVLAEQCDEVSFDTSIKYPILYGSAEDDERMFVERVHHMLEEKIVNGIIPEAHVANFKCAIDEEIRVFKKLGMCGFMLSMSELVCWCKEHNMAIGTARGSVGGSRVAYVTDIIDLNPEQWKTIFSRFCNESRVEVGDIDIDVVDTDRPAIFKYIVSRFGKLKTARVASFGTAQSKGVIDDVGRALAMYYSEKHENNEHNPWDLSNISCIKSEFDSDPEATKKKYPELFYYFDGLVDTKVSQSVHPAGMVISPVVLDENYGTFDKDSDNCLMIDMDQAHNAGLVKYDFLVLKSVKVVRDACEYIGIQYPKSNEINFDDENVWESLSRNQQMIFQFESPFAADSLKRMRPKSIFDMSLVTASIRPSGASYRDDLLKRNTHKNPSELIDELLKDNFGFLVYQEDIIKFLTDICGLSGSEADTVRRGIAKKKTEILEASMPRIVEGYCERSPNPREQAEEEVKEYLKIIEDASSYMFGYNHSIAYCLLGYYYAYFRYYYPIEFITSYLNNAANDSDIKTGTEYAGKVGIKITMPKWGISKSEYYFDKDKNIIAKGLSSIKYMSDSIATELYELAQNNTYRRFVDLLFDIDTKTALNTRQLDILIKIDFFSDFGNQRELLRIVGMFYDTFKKGLAKKIAKDKVDGTPLGEIVKKYSVGITKSGGEAKSYTLLDVKSVLDEAEDVIKSLKLEDLSDILKVKNFSDTMGYVGYISGKEEDRRKLYIMDLYELKRKKDGKQFGYSIITKSIGSGKESRFTVFNNTYKLNPIKNGDIILCKGFEREGQYYTLTKYEKIY